MAEGHKASSNLRSTAWTIVAGIGVLAVIGGSDWAAHQVMGLVWEAARKGLRLLPVVLAAAGQEALAHGFHGAALSLCLPRLVSCLPTLLAVAGAL